MSNVNSILTARWDSVTKALGTGRSIGRFLRYVQYRDHHDDLPDTHDLDGLLRYVAYRDVAEPHGRLFDSQGIIGDPQRLALSTFIARSTGDMPEPSARNTGGDPIDSRRAVYRLILSPEDARGLDLKRLTRSVMDQLATDAGTGGLPPWIAAEHRNTQHPHVHVVMAARREVSPDAFRTIIITGPRLQRMKEAMWGEIDRQRAELEHVRSSQGHALDDLARTPSRPTRLIDETAPDAPVRVDANPTRNSASPDDRAADTGTSTQSSPPRSPKGVVPAMQVMSMAFAMAAAYHRDADRLARLRPWASPPPTQQRRLERAR